jgi:hypothetical protein
MARGSSYLINITEIDFSKPTDLSALSKLLEYTFNSFKDRSVLILSQLPLLSLLSGPFTYKFDKSVSESLAYKNYQEALLKMARSLGNLHIMNSAVHVLNFTTTVTHNNLSLGCAHAGENKCDYPLYPFNSAFKKLRMVLEDSRGDWSESREEYQHTFIAAFIAYSETLFVHISRA